MLNKIMKLKGIRERHDGLKGHFASHRGWGVRLFGRPERQRQVDDHQAAHRRDRADVWSDRRQRLQPDEHCRAADPAAAPLRRRHLPGLPPDREENGLREPGLRHARRRFFAARDQKAHPLCA